MLCQSLTAAFLKVFDCRAVTKLAPRQREEIEQLVAAFRTAFTGQALLPTLSEASRLLQDATATLGWDDGLRATLVEIVMRSVDAAEQRFGNGGGAFKRQFVIDVVMMVLARDYLDLPLPWQVKDVIAPFIGIFVDWTVEVLNDARGPVWSSAIVAPRPRSRGWRIVRTATWWRTVRFLAGTYVWFQELPLRFSSYQRNLRQVAGSLAPARREIERVLPRASLLSALQQVGDIVVALGRLTKPYTVLVTALLRFVEEQRADLTDPRERRELVVATMQELLIEIYADDPLLLPLIQSPIGVFAIREMVEGIQKLLGKIGAPSHSRALMPAAVPAL